MTNIRDLNRGSDDFHLHPMAAPIHRTPPPEYAPRPVIDQQKPLIDQVNAMVDELHALRTKSANDDQMIALLKQQHAQARADLDGLHRKHAVEIERQRVDFEDRITTLTTAAEVAEQKALEVSQLLDNTAKHVMQGLRKMRDKTPLDPEIHATILTGEKVTAPPWRARLDETVSMSDG